MTKITKTIEVPFPGCDRCRYLTPEYTTMYSGKEPVMIFTRCANENICLEAVKISKLEEGKQ